MLILYYWCFDIYISMTQMKSMIKENIFNTNYLYLKMGFSCKCWLVSWVVEMKCLYLEEK